MKKLFEPVVGMVSGVGYYSFIEQAWTTVVVAFVSAIAAWLGKEACVCLKKQIVARRRKRNGNDY